MSKGYMSRAKCPGVHVRGKCPGGTWWGGGGGGGYIQPLHIVLNYRHSNLPIFV